MIITREAYIEKYGKSSYYSTISSLHHSTFNVAVSTKDIDTWDSDKILIVMDNDKAVAVARYKYIFRNSTDKNQVKYFAVVDSKYNIIIYLSDIYSIRSGAGVELLEYIKDLTSIILLRAHTKELIPYYKKQGFIYIDNKPKDLKGNLMMYINKNKGNRIKTSIRDRLRDSRSTIVDKEAIDPVTLGFLAVTGGFIVLSGVASYFIDKREKKKLAEFKIKLKEYAIRSTPAAINLINNFGSVVAKWVKDENVDSKHTASEIEESANFITEVIAKSKNERVNIPVFAINTDKENKWTWRNESERIKAFANSMAIYDGENSETLFPLARLLLEKKKPSVVFEEVDDTLDYLINQYSKNEVVDLAKTIFEDPNNVSAIIDGIASVSSNKDDKARTLKALLSFKKAVKTLATYVDTNISIVKVDLTSIDSESFKELENTDYEEFKGSDVTDSEGIMDTIKKWFGGSVKTEPEEAPKSPRNYDKNGVFGYEVKGHGWVSVVNEYICFRAEGGDELTEKQLDAYESLDTTLKASGKKRLEGAFSLVSKKTKIKEEDMIAYLYGYIYINKDGSLYFRYKVKEDDDADVIGTVNNTITPDGKFTQKLDPVVDAETFEGRFYASLDNKVDAEKYNIGAYPAYEIGDGSSNDIDDVINLFGAEGEKLKLVRTKLDGAKKLKIIKDLAPVYKLHRDYVESKKGILDDPNYVEYREAERKDNIDVGFERGLGKTRVFHTLALWYSDWGEDVRLNLLKHITPILKKHLSFDLFLDETLAPDSYIYIAKKDGTIYDLVFDISHDNDSFSLRVVDFDVVDKIRDDIEMNS